MHRRTHLPLAAALLLALAIPPPLQAQAPPSGDTLAVVRARGVLNCGVNSGVPGFAAPDSTGTYRGLDVDVCRALAAAIFGDASKVSYRPVTGQTRFPALQSGEIDVLTMEVTWTFARDAGLGVNFTAINYYDGQGFLVRRASGAGSARDLDGASICVSPGSATELTLADYFRQHRMSFTPVVIERGDDAAQAYVNGRCDVLTTDRGLLGARLSATIPRPEEHVILPDIVSKEPYSPVVRQGDDRWGDIVRWTIWAMIEAEEYGVTSANAEAMRASDNPTVQRLLGVVGDFGPMLGLRAAWAFDIIRQVGNYGESYDRNLTPLGLERGINRLWRDGGLVYAPPMR
ncbi:amino acid ABC transporter substrate-binding protein [Pseudoroseomonas deserti]|uniref:Amino acid ABC transporter substrate-binding protein n=1 Tax=Teichococcus deserti TaxID=1817963 RepID=A0A1V2H9S0_9PROT|nr:amino acid ABC transporter substrate-binding protein [Pseudoroseomonas deserti]ONG59130.1 amino acid ABC transporter substrate-binding protein [Pseudoroseomonas deserti]